MSTTYYYITYNDNDGNLCKMGMSQYSDIDRPRWVARQLVSSENLRQFYWNVTVWAVISGAEPVAVEVYNERQFDHQ